MLRNWFGWHQCNLATKDSGMRMHEQWWLHCRQWGQQILLGEHVYCVAVAFKMTEKLEQLFCIKFCIWLEHFSMETIQMIQTAFGDDAMSAVQIKVWHKHFKDGQEYVERDPHSGRSATGRTPENVERVWAAINKDWWLRVWEVEADLGIPKITVSEILTQDLVMKCVMAKFIP